MYRRLSFNKIKKPLSIFRVKALILFLFLIPFLVYSQTFEKIYRTNGDDSSMEAVETDDGYLISVNSGDFLSNYQSKILKFDFNGSIIDSILLPTFNGYITSYVHKIWKISDTSFLCILLVKNTFDIEHLQFIHFSENLNIVYDTIIDDTDSNNYTDFCITDNLNVVATGAISFFNEYFLTTFDIYGNKIASNSFQFNLGAFPSTVIHIPERDVFHLYIYWSNENAFLEINSDSLQVDTIMYYPDSFWPRNAIKGLDDTSYFIAGTQNSSLTSGIRLLSFVKMDNLGETIQQSNYLISQDTNSFYSTNSFSILNEEIFFGGTYNFNGSPPPEFSLTNLTPTVQ